MDRVKKQEPGNNAGVTASGKRRDRDDGTPTRIDELRRFVLRRWIFVIPALILVGLSQVPNVDKGLWIIVERTKQLFATPDAEAAGSKPISPEAFPPSGSEKTPDESGRRPGNNGPQPSADNAPGSSETTDKQASGGTSTEHDPTPRDSERATGGNRPRRDSGDGHDSAGSLTTGPETQSSSKQAAQHTLRIWLGSNMRGAQVFLGGKLRNPMLSDNEAGILTLALNDDDLEEATSELAAIKRFQNGECLVSWTKIDLIATKEHDFRHTPLNRLKCKDVEARWPAVSPLPAPSAN